MTAHRPKTLVRALVGLLSVGVVLAPVLVASTTSAKTTDPKFRKVSAPNVFYPVTGGKKVKDLQTYSKKHTATDIVTACGAAAWASHPGTAWVSTKPSWGGKYMVTVSSGRPGIITRYAYLTRVYVANGQIIQSGQMLGSIGSKPGAKYCGLQFSIAGSRGAVNPTGWLNAMVGGPPPVSGLFGTAPITLASFNMLGASHTAKGGRYATYPSRLVRAMSYFNYRGLDVIGTQEYQETQYDYAVSKGYGGTWGSYYWDPEGKRRDTENAIIWRKSTMEFVSGSTYDIPYFGGNTRHVPIVLLRQKSSGRTAYYLNVHNPADVRGPAAKWRAQALQIERKKIIELRATGRPVFITGDFNDRQPAFCALTASKLMISPNSIPSNTCAYPKESSIDWVFAAGQARFSNFKRDTATQAGRISDHPLVYSEAHLQY
jgi:endonuclease/exonuclease/phosphatase family metal-dependent hydrolase